MQVILKTSYRPFWAETSEGNHVAFILLNVADLPQMPTGANPRCANPRGKNVRRLVSSLRDDPAGFSRKNRGLNVLCSEAKTKMLKGGEFETSLIFKDLSVEGVIDGGHTLTAIKLYLKELYAEGSDDTTAQVKLFITCGDLDKNSAIETAEALNTSLQVSKKDLSNLKGFYEPIKELVSSFKFFNLIDFKSNEAEKSALSVYDIIALFYAMDVKSFPIKIEDGEAICESHPCDSYNSKSHIGDRWDGYIMDFGWSAENPYYKLRLVLPTLIELFEYIQINIADWYNSTDHSRYGAIVDGGGANRKSNAARRPGKTIFYQVPLEYHTPKSIVMPIFAALRFLLEEDENGYYLFKEDPFKFLSVKGGAIVRKTIAIMSSAAPSFSVAAKMPIAWMGIFDAVYSAYVKYTVEKEETK